LSRKSYFRKQAKKASEEIDRQESFVTIDREEVKKIFCKELDIATDQITDTLEYNTIPEWDSIGHMSLVAGLEEKFDIMIDTEDMVDMSTFAIACDIVQKYVDEN
jgi:acyl carrier protein